MASLAAVFIVKNEARCVRRAIESVAAHVDEVLVLDTGSTDNTIALARAAGARVETMPWPEDFSVARNAALDLADADYALVLDADEWVAAGGERLRDFVASAQSDCPPVGLADVSSSSLADGVPVESRTIAERLLPRGVRYAGRVHEQPVHDRPARPIGLTLGHDGYEPGQAAAKRGRNEALLRRALAETPADPYLWYQLGKDLQSQERYADAGRALLRAYHGLPAATGPGAPSPEAPYRHSLVVRALSVLGASGAFAEAVALLDAESERWLDSPDFHFALGNLFLDMALADPAATGELLPLVESSWLQCLSIGDRPDLAGSVRGRGSYLAAHNLAGLYDTLGDAATAATYRALATPR